MTVTLTDQARRYIALFEDLTGARARDCVVDEEEGRVLFVVAVGMMSQAIGPDGRTVARVEDRIGKPVELVEDADTPEAFVANALMPAAVYGVEVREEEGRRVAVAEVDPADKGAAIGSGGRNVNAARVLAARHYGIDDIRID